MSKKPWKKAVCECGICKRCKDRARLDMIKAGTWVRTRRVGSARQAAIDERKPAKAARREAKAQKKREVAAVRLACPPNPPWKRKRRAEAVKRNIDKYGLAHARYIAALITKKQKKEFVGGPRARAKVI